VSEVAKAWKQYTAPDGRPYFYNKITKESKWVQPEEMKAAAAAAAGGGGGGAAAEGAASGIRRRAAQVVPLSANGVGGSSSGSKVRVRCGLACWCWVGGDGMRLPSRATARTPFTTHL
jgi:hypothetical protein